MIDREDAANKFPETYRFVCGACKFATGDARNAQNHDRTRHVRRGPSVREGNQEVQS